MKSFHFIKSSYSNMSGDCVEVARNIPGLIAVRDSKAPDGPLIRVAPGAWEDFVQGTVTADEER